jgi:hypothetical protein
VNHQVLLGISALDIAIATLEKAISELESSVDSLEKWLWISSAAVAVGVIFEIAFLVNEYLEDRNNWRRGIVTPPSRPSLRVLFFEITSVVVVVAGIVGELWVGVISADRNTELRGKNTKLVGLIREKAGNAEKDAGDAKERASQNGLRAAALEKEAALITERLTKQDRRGNILRARRSEFVPFIKPFKGQKVDIRICPGNDSESEFFQLMLMGTLLSSEWQPMDLQSKLLGCGEGVVIFISPFAPESTKNAAKELVKGLRKIGLAGQTVPPTDGVGISTVEHLPGSTYLEPSSPDTVLVGIQAHP